MNAQPELLCITEVEIKIAQGPNKNLKAYVSLTINNLFVIKDLKIISSGRGLFVAMPARKGKDGLFHDTFHPVNQEARNYIENIIFEKYNKIINNS